MKNDAKKRHEQHLLQVYHAGQVTVVGFGGRTVETRIDFSPYRGVLTELIHRYNCRVLALDLAGVKLAPAGMLGVLAPIRKLVERIEIHNASDSARETLLTMQIGSLFELCDSVA
jgi:anti-sigma B factor antagonist